MTNQQDTALLPVAWMYERNDGQHRFVSMDRRGIILGEGPLGYTETPLFAAHRIAAEQAKPSASCEAGEVERVVDIKREIAERTRYAMGLLADLRETVDLDDESGDAVLSLCDDLETVVHNIAAVGSFLPALSERGAVGEEVAIPRALFDFLMGCGEIDGSSFSDLHESLPGRFWWRALLRTCDRAALSSIQGAGDD